MDKGNWRSWSDEEDQTLRAAVEASPSFRLEENF
jgi:hypothetical protein